MISSKILFVNNIKSALADFFSSNNYSKIAILVDENTEKVCLPSIMNKNELNNLLLVVNKKKSFDKRFIGDFELKNKSLFKYENNNFIYIGCQIINKKILNNISDTSFSISKVWNNELSKNNLNGFESTKEFFHVTDLEIFNEIIKS